MLLIIALFTSYLLQQKKIQAVHETVVSIFAGSLLPDDSYVDFQTKVGSSNLSSGMFVGLLIRVTPGHSIQKAVSFDYQFFFNLLLPPIILASGYELHQV